MAAADREDEVRRFIALGATRTADMNEWDDAWTVPRDSEGNEFCDAQIRVAWGV
jgi:hypothetical protein